MKNYILYPLILFIVAVICTSSITVVYSVTEPIIIKREEDKVDELLNSMYKDLESYDELDYEGTSSNIETIYQVSLADGKMNYAYQVTANGKEGPVKMLVSYDENGDINNLEYVVMNETPGIGDQVTEEDYVSMIIGQNAVNTDVDTITGATISSTAVKTSVEAASEDFKEAGYE